VIADRGASNLDLKVTEWNKMALQALTLPRPKETFEPLRKSMSTYLHLPLVHRKVSGKSLFRIPKVVYIDRQDKSRHLVPEDHEALVHLLEGMERDRRIEFVHGRFGIMELEE
jgi:hypothetical protein